MSRYAVITDLNRCVSCLNCVVACKEANGVPIGNFWIKILRVGPNPKYPGATYPDVEMYYLPVSCQHCERPACVDVCPTGASHKTENGSVQIDHDKCIGCQFCVMACPYGVRYLNVEQGVVEKCTRCYQKTNEGELPSCVTACGGSARFFGDLDAGYGDFRSRLDENGNNISLLDTSYVKPFTDDQVYALPDSGNGPSDRFILRNRVWR
ncbi:MAG: 4Fe-4S dicluster domain-containing protein [Coriobacteriales bacterium]|nr:4Fe-4S dicluster domain-containing protein [Coriobacteriales bacterium]